MLVAGTDTTYTLLEWAIAELINHPARMRKLQDEIRAAVGPASTGGGVVDEGRVAQLHYLKAVVKETLRLHAPVPLLVPREPPADAEILGYHVPARTRVVVTPGPSAGTPRRGRTPRSSCRRGSRAAPPPWT